MSTSKMDLGPSDVHSPSAAVIKKGPPTVASKEISSQERKRLPDSSFALPKLRKFPIHDAAHTRNAMARLEQQRGRMPASQYQQAKKNILRAYKKFGIKHQGSTLTYRHPTMGTFEIRHLSDKIVHCPGEEIVLASDVASSPAVWNQIAKPGHFRGHPAGEFRLDESIFAEIIRNFNDTQNREVPIDFEHASEMPATSGDVPVRGAPAQGWIKELRVCDGNLWGLVEWGELAREYIHSKKYKYLSPAIRFNSKDRVTGQNVGARLTSAAMTNCPYLDGMVPLAAKDSAMQVNAKFTMPSSEYMPKVKRMLRCHELATARECSEVLSRLEAAYSAGGLAGFQGMPVSEYVNSMREMTGAPFTSTVKEIFDAVKALIEAAIEEHEALQHPDNMDVDDDDVDDTEMSEVLQDDAISQLPTAMKDASMEAEKAEFAALTSRYEAETTALKNETATLQLQLRDASARAEALSAEVATLRDWKVQREEADLSARVEDAYETYKDVQKLSDTHKEAMLIVLKANPTAFEKLYPRVQKSQQHLLHEIAPPAPEDRKVQPAETVTLSLMDLTKKFMREGLSLEQASLRAVRLAG